MVFEGQKRESFVKEKLPERVMKDAHHGTKVWVLEGWEPRN
jgi:hypothetical protein